MADKVTWFEIPADDTARAGGFYSEVFGWNASDMGGGSLMVTSGQTGEDGMPLESGSINGDISPRSEGFDKPLLVITVDDIDEKVNMVKAAGGSVAVAPQLIEAMGMMWAIVTDTEGNNVGLLQDV